MKIDIHNFVVIRLYKPYKNLGLHIGIIAELKEFSFYLHANSKEFPLI